MLDLDKEEWALWKSHPLTRRVWASLEKYQQELRDRMFLGECLDGDSAESTALNYSTYVGIGQGLQEILGYEPEETKTGE